MLIDEEDGSVRKFAAIVFAFCGLGLAAACLLDSVEHGWHRYAAWTIFSGASILGMAATQLSKCRNRTLIAASLGLLVLLAASSHMALTQG